MAGDKVLNELEYYSVGGGFIEWKGYQPPKKGQPKYPYATMKELRQHAEKNNLSIAQVIMANEIAVSGKTEEQINAFLDKIVGAMLATVKSGLSVKEGVLPGPIKLASKASTVYERAMDEKYESDRAIALVSACALAASEENARGHLVITAPTGGSAGVMPAIVYALTESKRNCLRRKPARVCSLPRPLVTCASTTPPSPGPRVDVRPRLASPPPCRPRSWLRSMTVRRWCLRTPPSRRSNTTWG